MRKISVNDSGAMRGRSAPMWNAEQMAFAANRNRAFFHKFFSSLLSRGPMRRDVAMNNQSLNTH